MVINYCTTFINSLQQNPIFVGAWPNSPYLTGGQIDETRGWVWTTTVASVQHRFSHGQNSLTQGTSACNTGHEFTELRLAVGVTACFTTERWWKQLESQMQPAKVVNDGYD